jgi:hypothetical protein
MDPLVVKFQEAVRSIRLRGAGSTTKQQRLAIQAAIHGPDAAAVQRTVGRVDDGEDLGVLAAELLGLGRKQLLAYRHDLVAISLSRGHVHQPIVRVRLSRANIPDRRQILHPLRILFANVAQIQRQHRVFANAPAGHLG